MSDNPKNNPAEENDWNFDEFGGNSDDIFGGQGDEDESSPFGATDGFPSEFGASDTDDTMFGAMGSDDDEPSFGGDIEGFPDPEIDDDFGLQDMPSPDSFGGGASLGDPDEEFADVNHHGDGDNGFGNDFGGEFGADDDSSSDESDFPDQDEINNGFAMTSDGDEEEISSADDEDQQAEKKSGFDLKKLIFPGVAAAFLLGGSYVGWGIVSPLISGDSNVPDIAVSENVPPTVTEFPATLPSTDIAVVEQVEESAAVVPATIEPVPAVGDQVPDFNLPSLGTDEPVGAVEATVPTLPSVEDTLGSNLDELAGGRGGIDALREQEAPVDTSVIASINDRISDLESKLDAKFDQLNEKLDRLVSNAQPVAALPTNDFPSEVVPAAGLGMNGLPVLPGQTADLAIPEAGADIVPSSPHIPPLKPMIVENASLKGVSRDMGWIDTPSGVVEVRISDALPVGGTVLNFVNYRGNWMAVTSEGLITQ